MSNVTAKEAFNTLKTNFNLQELKTLAFSVGIPYEDLEGSARSGKALAMVQYAQRHGKFDQLVTEMMAPRDEDGALTPPAAATTSNVINHYYHGDVIQGDKVGGDKVGGDNIEIGSITDSSGIAVGKDSSAEVTSQTTLPADPPPTVNQYTFNGSVVASQIGDGNSIQAQNIAGGNITIGTKEEFQTQLTALEALIQEAIANKEISANEIEDVLDDVQDAAKELTKETPSAKRLTSRLECVQEVLDKAAGVTAAAGKVGSAVLKAAPIVASLIKAASNLF